MKKLMYILLLTTLFAVIIGYLILKPKTNIVVENDVVEEVVDTDGDGYPDWLEEIQGTDKNNPRSFSPKKNAAPSEEDKDENYFEYSLKNIENIYNSYLDIIGPTTTIEQVEDLSNRVAENFVNDIKNNLVIPTKRVNVQEVPNEEFFINYNDIFFIYLYEVSQTEQHILNLLKGDFSKETLLGVQEYLFVHNEFLEQIKIIETPPEKAYHLQELINITAKTVALLEKVVEVPQSVYSILFFQHQKETQLSIINISASLLSR